MTIEAKTSRKEAINAMQDINPASDPDIRIMQIAFAVCAALVYIGDSIRQQEVRNVG
jgi:hypothetical protein